MIAMISSTFKFLRARFRTSQDHTRQGGYALAVFLILIALLAATVASFSLISINNLQDARNARGQEVGYQMARAGLDFWLNRVRKDWAFHHSNPSICRGSNPAPGDPESPNRSEYCKDKTPTCTGPTFSLTKTRALCCDWGKVEDRTDHFDDNTSGTQSWSNVAAYTKNHAWGWGAFIKTYSWSDNYGYTMGERVYLPSASSYQSDGDFGYFEIILVEDAEGEFSTGDYPADFDNSDYDDDYNDETEISCRDPMEKNTTINVNTASYDHLRQVDYKVDPDKELTHEMAMALIEHRSGNTYDKSPGDTFPLSQEDYELGSFFDSNKPDSFTSKKEVCDVLASVDDYFETPDGCSGIWGYSDRDYEDQKHFNEDGQSYGTFCAKIEGGRVNQYGEVTGRVRIRAKVSRPSTTVNCGVGGIKVLSVERL